MDITIQGLDGIYATQSIMEYDSGSKIIMITSRGQEDMVVDSIKAGALGYILKPITTDKVLQLLDKIFSNKTKDDEEFLDD